MAVLTEIGATAGNIRRLALLNLVSNWSYATDASLSYWKQLSTRSYKDEAELLEQDAVKNIGLGDLAFHHAISTKLRPADKGVRLAFDPGVFDLLERHDEQEYRLEPLIRALKAPTLLINRHSQLDLFQPHHLAAESDGRRVYLCELRGDGSEPVEDASVVLPVFGFLAAARG